MNFLKNLITGQVVKGYTLSGEPITGVGHHKCWKLYKGKKDSTGGQVSIFVLDKKALKPAHKQEVIKSAKKQVSSLAKIRHPGVLALIQPLTEDQSTLSFVTQRVEAPLSVIIKQKRLEQFVASELQLKLNLFPLLQAINFLHQIVKLCHLGLNFDSIYITNEGKWKIAGMNYVQVLTGEQEQVLQNKEFFDYLHLGEEVVKEGKFNKFSDSYSLGIMFINFMILLKKAPNQLMQPTESRQMYWTNSKSYKEYSSFPAIIQSTAPQELIQLLSQLLTSQSSYRLSISSLESSKWINDPIILTVKYLQKIANYENKQQVEFLKGLAGVIDKFSGKVLHNRIIPSLTNLLKFNHLVASIIFILCDIMKKTMITVDEFRKHIWPQLKNITQGKQMTAQSLYLLVSNMEILQKYVTEDNFMSCIIPLYVKCFDCPPKLKALALRQVERLTKKYDYQFTKTKIVPKLVNTMKDDKIQIRKDSLKALFSIINRLDPHTIVNVVLSGLENCRKAGADPFINAITVELYNKITVNMSAEVLATKIMPGLMPYLIDPTIEKEEFQMYKNALSNMITRIQQERKKTWAQSNQTMNLAPYEKFSEKDFVLDKLQETSSVQNSINNESKFDFLNGYKATGSTTNTTYGQDSMFALQQQHNQQAMNLVASNSNPTIQINFQNSSQESPTFSSSYDPQASFGISVPQNQVQKIKQQSPKHEITVTGGNSFSSGFGIQTPSQTNSYKFDFGDSQGQNKAQSSVTSRIKEPTFDFNSGLGSQNAWNTGISSNNNQISSFSFGNTDNLLSQADKKVQSKEQPFSPITQALSINPGSKPILKGPSSQSPSKKLVGPSQSHTGGIKKPPKVVQNQSECSTSYTAPFQQTSVSNNSVGSSFQSPSFFPTVTSYTPPVIQKTSYSSNSNDDPFAEVEQQYGISMNSNVSNPINVSISMTQQANAFGGFSVNNPQQNQNKSNDPFDDLL